jgi:hypothetical protein
MSYPYNPPPPSFDALEYQRRQDEEHLRLLAILHYVLGALTAVGSCFFLLYVGMGMMMLNQPGTFSNGHPNDAPPAAIGWMFTLIGVFATLLGWLCGGLTIYAGKCLSERRASTFIQVMACLNCLHMPLGTALGVFTLIVVNRPTVRELFAPREPQSAYAPSASSWDR